MIKYNNPLQKLAEAGYTSYILQKHNLISGSTLDRLRKGLSVSTNTIDTICKLCHCQPCDIISYDENGEG